MTAIPTWSVSLPSGAIAYWLSHNSSTTQIIGTDGNQFRQRCLVWDTAGGQSTALYSGGTCYFLIGFRLVTGNPGRFLDWHIQPNDSPWGWTPPYCPSVPNSGVSPFALDYYSGSDGLYAAIQPEQSTTCGGSGQNKYQIFTLSEIEARRGQWVWLWGEIVFGRRATQQGDATRAGSLRMWLAGENTPRVNAAAPRHTIFYQQHQMTVLQGTYWSTGSPGVVVEHAAVRFGTTPQQCFLDVPVFQSGAPTGLEGGGGPGSHTDIADRQHDEAAIPSELDWTSGGPGDTTAPELSSAAVLNAGSSLIYSEPLNNNSVPQVGDYVYKVNSSPVTISSLQVVNERVDLFLQNPVSFGDTVTVSYTRASGREVKDVAGNLAANLTDQAVSNNTAAPTQRITTISRSASGQRVNDPTGRVAGLGGGGL